MSESNALTEKTSHHDISRSGVALTAHLVAIMRSKEYLRGEDALFKDPYAAVLGGDINHPAFKPILKERLLKYGYVSSSDHIEDKDLPLEFTGLCSVRTRYIDDKLDFFLKHKSISQVCVLGAGLDTRPWRIQTDNKVKYFELDFPEIFNYKLPLLEKENAETTFDYHPISADLSIENWEEKLLAEGFIPTELTFWLMEGFTGYLLKEELDNVFLKMNRISSPGSYLLATFLTPKRKETALNMHRFMPENPLLYVYQKGWIGEQHEVSDIANDYNRGPLTTAEGYYFVSATFQP